MHPEFITALFILHDKMGRARQTNNAIGDQDSLAEKKLNNAHLVFIYCADEILFKRVCVSSRQRSFNLCPVSSVLAKSDLHVNYRPQRVLLCR